MRTATLAVWSALLIAALVLETLGRRDTTTFAPLKGVLRALRSASLGRGALVLAWIWLGWHLFAR